MSLDTADQRQGASTAPHRKIIHIDMDAFYASVEQRDKLPNGLAGITTNPVRLRPGKLEHSACFQRIARAHRRPGQYV
jgi:hypothetical protein